MGGGGVGRQLEADYTMQEDYLEYLQVLVIGPDKPRGPKGHFTNTGVKIRPVPPI